MKGPRSLGEFFARPDSEKEVYSTDQKKRLKRAQKGYIARDGGSFDFIYLIRNWDKVVGKLMSQNTIPHKIVKSTLIVMTKHNVFAQELSFMSPQIIQKIEENIPDLKGRIKKIKFSHANYSSSQFQADQFQADQFQAGQFQEDNARQATFKKPNPVSSEAAKLHPYSPHYQIKKKKAEQLFSDIEDGELKDLLSALFLKNF